MNSSNNFLRPNFLCDFFGQEDIVNQLKVYIFSAKSRETCLDHVLLYGPPGLGKTSLATIISNEMDTRLISISAPSIENQGDLAQILSTINPGDVLFIDEIHRLGKECEEILYSVLEDFKLNISYKSQENVKVVSIDIPPFTLIGATTKIGLISNPFRERFLIKFKFNYYSDNELCEIISNNSNKMDMKLSAECCMEIAKRSRETPRIANFLLKRIFDYILFKKSININIVFMNEAFGFLGIDEDGFNKEDILILKLFYDHYKNTPVSLEAIANLINEDSMNISEINEPFLVSNGYLERTRRGRMITKKGINKYEKYLLERK